MMEETRKHAGAGRDDLTADFLLMTEDIKCSNTTHTHISVIIISKSQQDRAGCCYTSVSLQHPVGFISQQVPDFLLSQTYKQEELLQRTKPVSVFIWAPKMD